MSKTKISRIVPVKERNYKGRIGDIQFWEESDENLTTTYSTGNTWDFTQETNGIYLGSLKFGNNITKEEAKEVYKIIKDALAQKNPKVKVVKHRN